MNQLDRYRSYLSKPNYKYDYPGLDHDSAKPQIWKSSVKWQFYVRDTAAINIAPPPPSLMVCSPLPQFYCSIFCLPKHYCPSIMRSKVLIAE